MEGIVTQLTNFNAISTSIVTQLIGLVLLLTITGLAYWHRERALYIIAGCSFVIYGIFFVNINTYIGLFIILIGCYDFVKAVWERKRK